MSNDGKQPVERRQFLASSLGILGIAAGHGRSQYALGRRTQTNSLFPLEGGYDRDRADVKGRCGPVSECTAPRLTEIVDPAAKTASVDLEAVVDSRGRLAVAGNPLLEGKEWIPPVSDEYTVTVSYSLTGRVLQELTNGLDHPVGTRVIVLPYLIIADLDDDTDDMVASKSFKEYDVLLPEGTTVAGDVIQFLVEFSIKTKYGPIAGFATGEAFEVIREKPEHRERINAERTGHLSFEALEGHRYNIGIALIAVAGGISGNGGFRTAVTADLTLDEFYVTNDGGPTRTNTVEVSKTGTKKGLSAFAVGTNGEIVSGDDSEAVISGGSMIDWVGPDRGTDRIEVSGQVTKFLIKGPATVFLNGEKVNPDHFGALYSTDSYSDTVNLPNRLTVTKDGVSDGQCAFMVTVSGDLGPGRSSEAVFQKNSALDFLGPKRGTDELRFSGEITDFVMKGQAAVSINGERVNPDTLGRY